MVPVPDKVKVPHLNQIHRRKRPPPLPRGGDAQPASAVVIVKRVKVAVKVAAATLTAYDLVDGHQARPGIEVAMSGREKVAPLPDLFQDEQAARAPGQGCPKHGPLAPGAGVAVEQIRRVTP
jgi:hypothetical protein